ncbi:MAG: PadR family transcriptional regulator [Anaerolineae bacterium]|nr:PadR family transcriptional regulator [Anaerolineae bacterium]MDW8068986.1 PadR family transcriptional regulator [Anaerolineae bacterium]
MSLPYAVLGFLNYAPMTGYELKKAFDTSIRHFWPADQAQIYRTLKELTRRGWVTVEVVPQEDRPNRKVYHITDAGREELRRWLGTPADPEDPRVPLLIRIFFAGQLPSEKAIALLETYAAALRARLETYARIPQRAAHYAEAIQSPREVFFWALTLDYGIRLTRAALEWAEEAIRNIRNLEKQ